MKNIRIKTLPYRHHFKKPFKIAHGERNGTDVVIVQLQLEGQSAYGEASLPPYLPDTVNGTLAFFDHPIFKQLEMPENINSFWQKMDKIIPGHYPAKAALDMALWSLKSQLENKSIAETLEITSQNTPAHSFTIGIGSEEDMLENIQDGLAHGFRFFKLKLNGNEDLERVAFFRRVCELPFAIDINQAWQSIDYALNTAKEIEAMGCVLIEQPFDKFDRQLSAQLTHDLHIPVIADEACQGLDDIKGIAGNFDGINIKLQKCGGITPALELIRLARAKNLNILIGCMSESTIACSAAEVLSPLADWADLDGPWLIRENPDPETLFKS